MGQAGEPAVVEGVKGAWRVDPAQLGQPFSERAGKLDALADCQAGVLRVHAIHQDVPLAPAMTEAIAHAVENLAAGSPCPTDRPSAGQRGPRDGMWRPLSG